MVKKLLLGSLVAAAAAGMMLGSDALSYARTFGRNVRTAVQDEISPEFELDRIRGEVERLMPEIRRHMAVVAEQVVDVRDLEKAIADKQMALTNQKDAILALRQDLDEGRSHYVYRAVSYSRTEVEADLADRFDSYRVAEDSVKRDREILTAQRDTLRANQQKLDTMLSRKEDLAVKIAQLEARMKQIEAAEAIHQLEIDDSCLKNVEDLIDRVNHELDVRESMLETEGRALGRIPVEEDGEARVELREDVTGQIDSYFGLTGDESLATADTASSI